VSNSINSYQIGPKGYNLRSIFGDAKEALAEMSAIERGLHIFWFLGPFILLIERSPADIWLTLLALAFVIRVILRRDGGFLTTFWVRAGLGFWGVCLLSSGLSADPAYALGETLAWIRFPLFAAANAFWLARDRRLLYAMLLSTALGLLTMCGILTAEILIEGQKGGRLTWPYGDLTPGNYIADVGMPAFVIFVAFAIGSNSRLANKVAVLVVFTMFVSMMTGERMSFIIRSCAGMLGAMFWKPRWQRYLAFIYVEFLAIVALFLFHPSSAHRFVTSFIETLPTNPDSAYHKVMSAGLTIFETSPVLGIGVGNMRNMCANIVLLDPGTSCQNHPHNFYIQMAAETGIVGLIIGSIFLFSIVWTCFKASRQNKKNIVAATLWVVPLLQFMPLTSSHDFFGQWNNIFMWSAVALALASVNLSEGSQPNQNNL
jgi:O-antigen ligase